MRLRLDIPLRLAAVSVCLATWLTAPSLAGARRRISAPIYVSPGITLGGTASVGDDRGSGFTLGGELSTVVFRKRLDRARDAWALFYFGTVVDGIYDWHRHGGRMMVGPLVGLGFFGLDGGYLADYSGGTFRHGAAVRAFATLGIAAVYVRYGALQRSRDFVEAGMMLKIPLGLFGTGSRYRSPTICLLTGHFC